MLIEHCKSDPLKETCGLVFGEGKIVRNILPAMNISKEPDAYIIDPHSTAHIFDHDFIGTYHSHRQIPAVPSSIDVSTANLPGKYYIIYSLKHEQLRSWIWTGYKFVGAPIFIKKFI